MKKIKEDKDDPLIIKVYHSEDKNIFRFKTTILPLEIISSNPKKLISFPADLLEAKKAYSLIGRFFSSNTLIIV